MSDILASTVVTQVRGLVKDDVADSAGNYRWADTGPMLRYLNAARREAVRRHPEAQYVDRVENPALVDMVATTELLGILDTFQNSLAFYVAAMLMFEDADDSANKAKGADFLALFEKEMT